MTQSLALLKNYAIDDLIVQEKVSDIPLVSFDHDLPFGEIRHAYEIWLFVERLAYFLHLRIALNSVNDKLIGEKSTFESKCRENCGILSEMIRVNHFIPNSTLQVCFNLGFENIN